jgi:hypothetical protein
VALLSDSSQNYWVLHSRGCVVDKLELPSTPGAKTELIALTDDEEVLYSVLSRGAVPIRYVLFDLSSGKARGSVMPQPQEGAPNFPRFSTDGRWAAWIADTPGEQRVHGGPVEQLAAGFTFKPNALYGLSSYSVVDVSRGGQEILLEKYPREYLLVDSKGSLIRTFRPDAGVLPFNDIRLSRDGTMYLAWDGGREQGRWIVQWRINGRVIRREMPEYSTISHATVSSDWKWIAVSSNANTKALRGIEAVTVWSWDGTVRIHKRLRDDTRTPVVFLDGNLFAYNEYDHQGHGGTRVLRLPGIGE